ncbi:hypothetical protein GCM10029992_40430 [Glycomyces albus]
MFKRMIWVGIGVAVGVVVVRKLTKAKESITPGGVADRVSGAGAEMKESIRAFWSDVSEAKRAKENELFDAIERGDDIVPLLTEEDDQAEAEPGRR